MWFDRSEFFSVKVCTSKLTCLRLLFFSPGVVLLDWEKVWNVALPLKVSFLVWAVLRRRSLTQSSLQSRGFKLASRCYLCKSCVEDDVHLFLNCSVTRQVIAYFGRGQSARWTNSLEEFITQWRPRFATEQGRQILSCIPHVLLWVIWQERNARCFDEKGVSVEKLIIGVKELAWRWGLGGPLQNNLRLEQVIFDWELL